MRVCVKLPEEESAPANNFGDLRVCQMTQLMPNDATHSGSSSYQTRWTSATLWHGLVAGQDGGRSFVQVKALYHPGIVSFVSIHQTILSTCLVSVAEIL